MEVVCLTSPPHIFSVQVNSEVCYIPGQWGRVQNEIKPNPNSYSSIIFHDKIFVFTILTAYFIREGNIS